jgi:3-dehydroquinate synthetase
MTPVEIQVTAGGAVATDVVIGRGVVDQDPILPDRDSRAVVAVMAQPGPAGAIAQRLVARFRDRGLRSEVRLLADRDDSKQLIEIDGVYHWLHDLGLSRFDTVVVVGGGAATDAGGFAAATYLRGVEAVYVSTTLLGAVDAAIGGKTGINHGGKNLVGAFAHPRRVVVDLDVLDALPEDVLREGFAEAVKTGFIADPVIVDLCERHGLAAPLDEIVPRSMAVKADVVSEDFREAARRAWLNYGHTLGHGVEIVKGISHGDAVGVGMVAASAVSEAVLGFSDRKRHDDVIRSLGLPTDAAGIDRERVLDLVARDKKRDATGLKMVLLERIGGPTVVPVGPAEVEIGLQAIGLGA